MGRNSENPVGFILVAIEFRRRSKNEWFRILVSNTARTGEHDDVHDSNGGERQRSMVG